MVITKEKVLSAESVVGIVRQYGTEQLARLCILFDEDDVVYFDCENRVWHRWNSDFYWDLYESEIMLTVMRSFTPEEAVEILEKMNAFCQV